MAALLCLTLGCFGTAAYALDPDRAMSQYLRDRWEGDNGFPGGGVHAITQTADGYLWIAADKGLVRFDGLTFRLFLPPGVTPGSDVAVRALAADSDGSLWIQLRSARLLRYRQGEFADVTVDPDRKIPFVTAMSHGIDGAMLFALIGHYVIVSRAGRFDTVMPQNVISTPGSFVISIAQTADSDVWLGTRDSGLLRVHDGRVTSIVKGLPDQKINSLLTNELHDLWVGTDNGVARWNGSEFSHAGLPEALDHLSALAMIRDGDSNVWIGSASRGLLRINGRGLATLDEPGSNRWPAVTAIFEDRDRNVWFGTTRGIERLRDGVFTTYAVPQGLPPDGYGPVYVESDRIWIAPADGGLLCLCGGHLRTVEAGGLKNDVIYSITGSPGEVWLGRRRGGLTVVRTDGDTFTARSFTQADGLAQNNVYAVQRAADGSLWAGTLSGGVSRFKDHVFTTYTTENGLASNTVAAIMEGADGTMWFATPNGVSAFTRGRWRRYAVGDGLPSNDVNTLFEDSTHNLWIGTAAGLAVFRNGRIQSAVQYSPLLGGSILGLAEDRLGSLWIMTSDRVLRVNRDRLALGALDVVDCREYGLADGLPGMESVKRHRTVVADDRGRIWLSMNRGLAMADPVRVASHVTPPVLVHVEGISADGSLLERREDISIPPRRQRIVVAFTGLSLSVPERVMFRYRLDGFDRDWSEPALLRQEVYTNLGPGTYEFHVIASNSDGVWNPSDSTMRFAIAPAYWQTSWFRLSAMLLVTVMGWTMYRVRLGQVARQLNLRFEERLAERTRIAQELHDTLLQGFVSASMQLHVAADRLPPDSSAKSSLGRVVDLMGRVIEEGRNAVRSLRASSSESDDLKQAFSGIAAELGTDGHPDYRVIVEGRVRRLSPIIRDDVYRIGCEALVNAFRHSNAKRVEIELRYGSSELRMLVRDNGCGIDSQILKLGREGHWGLPGMRERAKRIGARFKVWSSASAGTEVELSVPGRVAFATERSDRRQGLRARWRQYRLRAHRGDRMESDV